MTVHLHLAQRLAETQAIAEQHSNQTPVQYLESIGFLGPEVLATHVSYVTENDMDVIARTRSTLLPARPSARRALGRPDLGHLEVGARGDAVAIDLSIPFNTPVFDPLRFLVYYSSGADVMLSVADGKPMVLNHKVVGKKAGASCRRI